MSYIIPNRVLNEIGVAAGPDVLRRLNEAMSAIEEQIAGVVLRHYRFGSYCDCGVKTRSPKGHAAHVAEQVAAVVTGLPPITKEQQP